MNMIEAILQKMSKISKPQRNFLMILLTTIQLLPGPINFRNLSRYSDLNEKTYSRQFRNDFDFVEFNRNLITDIIPANSTLIGAMDCSFTEKSGKHTYGIDKFYNSTHSQVEKGLEFSTLCVVDVDYNTAYNLSVRQTPATSEIKIDAKKETRVDFYVQHFKQDCHALPKSVRYIAVDGFYAKSIFVDGIYEIKHEDQPDKNRFDVVGKLRHDANLRYLYKGSQKPHGRRRLYDGKVKFDDVSRFEFVKQEENQTIYTAVVYSVSLKRKIRIVYIVEKHGQKIGTALLYSTDINLAAENILRYYSARFQIEFLFRDAKQFTGFSDCQARCQKSLHFHANSSMTALNLLKVQDRQFYKNFNSNQLKIPDSYENSDKHVISIASLPFVNLMNIYLNNLLLC
jgi:hypothetical protein